MSSLYRQEPGGNCCSLHTYWTAGNISDCTLTELFTMEMSILMWVETKQMDMLPGLQANTDTIHITKHLQQQKVWVSG